MLYHLVSSRSSGNQEFIWNLFVIWSCKGVLNLVSEWIRIYFSTNIYWSYKFLRILYLYNELGKLKCIDKNIILPLMLVSKWVVEVIKYIRLLMERTSLWTGDPGKNCIVLDNSIQIVLRESHLNKNLKGGHKLEKWMRMEILLPAE